MLSLPDSVPGIPQIIRELGFHLNGRFIRHGIQELVQLREKPYPIPLHDARVLDACLVPGEPLYRIEARDANVDTLRVC